MPFPIWENNPHIKSSDEDLARFFRESFLRRPDTVMISQGEYQELRAMAHNCFFRHSLTNGLPIIPRDDLAQREWFYKTAPERLEVSMEIWESIKAIKSPFEWSEFEDALWSTQ